MMWYDVTWCDMMCYDVIWCVMMWYDVIWCDMMWYDVTWCVMMWYDVIWCDMIRYCRLVFFCFFNVKSTSVVIAEDCVKSSQSLVGEPQCPCLCTSIVGRQGNGVLKWATTPHRHNMSLNWENDKPCEFRVTSFSTNLVPNGFISHQSPSSKVIVGNQARTSQWPLPLWWTPSGQLRSPSIEFCGVLLHGTRSFEAIL